MEHIHMVEHLSLERNQRLIAIKRTYTQAIHVPYNANMKFNLLQDAVKEQSKNTDMQAA